MKLVCITGLLLLTLLIAETVYQKVSMSPLPGWNPALAKVIDVNRSKYGQRHPLFAANVVYRFNNAGKTYENTLWSASLTRNSNTNFPALNALVGKSILIYYCPTAPQLSTSPEVADVFSSIVFWNYVTPLLTIQALVFIVQALREMNKMKVTVKEAEPSQLAD